MEFGGGCKAAAVEVPIACGACGVSGEPLDTIAKVFCSVGGRDIGAGGGEDGEFGGVGFSVGVFDFDGVFSGDGDGGGGVSAACGANISTEYRRVGLQHSIDAHLNT